MIKNYAPGVEYTPPTVEKMLSPAPYEKERVEALKWFQENLRSPTLDERAGSVSVVHTSDQKVSAVSVGVYCGIRINKRTIANIDGGIVNHDCALDPQVMRELATALLICAERAEHPDRMIVEK